MNAVRNLRRGLIWGVVCLCCAAAVTGLASFRSAGPAAALSVNAQAAYSWFATNTNLTRTQISGVVGNLMAEGGSGLNPTVAQIGCDFVAAAAGTTYCGVGIAQWTYNSGRYNNLIAFAKANSFPLATISAAPMVQVPATLEAQLAFVWNELNGSYSNVLSALRSCGSIDCSTTVIEYRYEIPGLPASSFPARLSYASAVLAVAGVSTNPIFELRADGGLFVSNGSGWTMLDASPGTSMISAGGGTVFQLHRDGTLWRSTGAACSPGCSGWTMLDANPGTSMISAGGGLVYQLRRDGSILRSTGAGCGSSCSGWAQLDANPATIAIAVGGGILFQLHGDGSIWRSTAAACSPGCSGWVRLDANPQSSAIAAGNTTVFQMHAGESAWRWTGVACNPGCSGWTRLDASPVVAISTSGEG